jgi:organic radical activating enzyme
MSEPLSDQKGEGMVTPVQENDNGREAGVGTEPAGELHPPDKSSQRPIRIPKFLILESTNCCMLQCKGCGATQHDFRKGFMSLDFYKSMVDSAARDGLQDKTIIMAWANGEPLMHPEIMEMMEYTTQRGFRTYITTNGMIWNERLFRWMLHEPKHYQLIFSLDGLWDRGNIVKARPGSDEARIRKTIEGVLALKRETGSRMDVLVKIVERGQDHEEIERYIDYWLRQEGLSCVVVGKMLDSSMKTDDMRLFPCQYPDESFFLVRWDGTPTLCMYQQDMMNKQVRPMRKIEAGESIIEYFNTGVYKQFHDEQEQGIFRAPCNTCSVAYTGTGWKGTVQFRDPKLLQQPIYYRADFYNQFFSLTDNPRSDTWYGYHSPMEGREWLRGDDPSS